MNVDAYLHRIDYRGSRSADAATLRALHVAHLMAVPFENLSIHRGERIVLSDAALFEKVVVRRRGGFCYELNGLFAALLRELGFEVAMLSAGVMGESGRFGPEFDHMALLVRLDERWLLDVGFGDSFREPLRLDEIAPQPQGRDVFRMQIDERQDRRVLMRDRGGEGERPQYRFGTTPYEYADYEAMCAYHQASPDSPFPRQRLCSRALPVGRVTLSDMRLVTSVGAERHERLLKDEHEYAHVLRESFGIELAPGGFRDSGQQP